MLDGYGMVIAADGGMSNTLWLIDSHDNALAFTKTFCSIDSATRRNPPINHPHTSTPVT